jgi:hypothetical protein
MGKTRKHKPHARNKTKKQKGGLCCKYENDSLYCRKDTFINSKNVSITDPIFGPTFKHNMYEPIRFKGETKVSPGSDNNATAFVFKGVNIGFTHHSLKHMESLGIKCYDMQAFSKIIKTICENAIWIHVVTRDIYISDHKNNNEPWQKWAERQLELSKNKKNKKQKQQRTTKLFREILQQEYQSPFIDTATGTTQTTRVKVFYPPANTVEILNEKLSGNNKPKGENFSDFIENSGKNFTNPPGYSGRTPFQKYYTPNQKKVGFSGKISALYIFKSPVKITGNMYTQNSPTNEENIKAIKLRFGKFDSGDYNNILFLHAIELLDDKAFDMECQTLAYYSGDRGYELDPTSRNPIDLSPLERDQEQNVYLNNRSDCNQSNNIYIVETDNASSIEGYDIRIDTDSNGLRKPNFLSDNGKPITFTGCSKMYEEKKTGCNPIELIKNQIRNWPGRTNKQVRKTQIRQKTDTAKLKLVMEKLFGQLDKTIGWMKNAKKEILAPVPPVQRPSILRGVGPWYNPPPPLQPIPLRSKSLGNVEATKDDSENESKGKKRNSLVDTLRSASIEDRLKERTDIAERERVKKATSRFMKENKEKMGDTEKKRTDKKIRKAIKRMEIKQNNEFHKKQGFLAQNIRILAELTKPLKNQPQKKPGETEEEFVIRQLEYYKDLTKDKSEWMRAVAKWNKIIGQKITDKDTQNADGELKGMIINWYSFKYNCLPDYKRDESVAEPILHAIDTKTPPALTKTDFEKCITLAYNEILQSRSNTEKVETIGETKVQAGDVQYIGTRTLQDKFAEAVESGNVINVGVGGKKTRKKKMHRTKRRKRKTKRRKRRKRKHKRTRKR